LDPSLDGGSSTINQPREFKVEMSTKNPEFEVIGKNKRQSEMSLDGQQSRVLGISPAKYA